jgi:hypothetical protein
MRWGDPLSILLSLIAVTSVIAAVLDGSVVPPPPPEPEAPVRARAQDLEHWYQCS